MDEREATIEHGLIVRAPNGRFLPGTASPAPITSATARSMQEKRWTAYRQTAARRIAGELADIDPTIDSPREAWGALAAKQAVALWDEDKPRADDLVRIGQVMGALPTAADRNTQEQPGTVRLSASIPVEQLLALAQALKRDVVDVPAEASEE